jgi:hypothetical protein
MRQGRLAACLDPLRIPGFATGGSGGGELALIPQPGVLGAQRAAQAGWSISTRKIERNEFGDAAWRWGGGRNAGCVKGGLPLVLTLDAACVLQQVEAAAVNLL